MRHHWIQLALLCSFFLLSACDPAEENQPLETNTASSAEILDSASKKQVETARSGKISSDEDNQAMHDATPEIAAYLALVRNSLTQQPPVLKLDVGSEKSLSDEQQLAQFIATTDTQFGRFLKHPVTSEALRNEIMNVRPALPGDFRAGQKPCPLEQCYRVDMYNFFFNINSTAIVDIKHKKTIAIDHQENTQPDLNPRLIQLARKIADNSPDVIAHLQEAGTGTEVTPTMVEIKTALKNSRCERSKHLCVAPTYVVGSHALWAIVDLTDLKLVGVKWSELGEQGPPVTITERTLENEMVFNEYCEKTHHHQQGDWSFDYNLTSSDGIRLTDVRFKGQAVMRSVKLVDWHVSYSSRENFGYSDAIGCPMFSSAVVVAYKGPTTEPITAANNKTGFAFKQDFRQLPWPAPCNYRYEQRFEFYDDGRFRIAMADYGRGCGTDGTYRPVARIDLVSPDSTAPYEISEWADSAWQTWQSEKWALRHNDAPLFEDKYAYKVQNASGSGYLIEPGRGQFGDGGRGDNAYFYATVYHPDRDEGDRDLVTLGSCCNTDHRQGPELFQNPPESIIGQDTVLWYVPQIKNDGAAGSEYCWADTRVVDGSPEIKVWPCFAGPMFVPLGLVHSTTMD